MSFGCNRCVLELHAIAGNDGTGGGRFEVAMTAQERNRFLNGVRYSTKMYYNMLGHVNAESSDCSRAVDRESIHEAIRSSVGFAKLNRIVFQVLEGWMEKELRQQLEWSAASKAENAVHEWQHVLATVLMQQGRLVESVALLEACLKHLQRVHGEDDLKTSQLTCCGMLCSS
jgi:hypothetical protein